MLSDLCWAISFFTTHAYLLRIVPFTMEWALPHQLLTKIIFQKLGHRIIWWRQLFKGGFSFLLTLGYIKLTIKFKQDTFPIQNNILCLLILIFFNQSLYFDSQLKIMRSIPHSVFNNSQSDFSNFLRIQFINDLCSSKFGGIQFKLFLLYGVVLCLGRYQIISSR